MYNPKVDIAQLAIELERQSRCKPKRSRKYLRVSSPFRADSDNDTFSFNLRTGGGRDFKGKGYNAEQIAAQLNLGYAPSRLPQPKPPPAKDGAASRAFRRRAAKVLGKSLDLPQDVLAWLAGRGIDADAAAAAGLRWAGRGARFNERGLLIPYKRGGAYVAVRTRDGKRDPKYMAIKDGSGSRLYNGDAITDSSTVIIVESELDAIAIAALTDFVAVATGSVSGGRDLDDVQLVRNAAQVFIAFDADTAGESAAAWWMKEVGASRILPEGECKDVGEMFEAGIDVAGWLRRGMALQLSHNQIAGMAFATSNWQLNVDTVAAVQHGRLPAEFTTAQAKEALAASPRSVERFLPDAMVIERVGHGCWRLSDQTSFTLRLQERIWRKHLWEAHKHDYTRALVNDAYDAGSISESEWQQLHDDAGDAPTPPAPFSAEFDDTQKIDLPEYFTAGWWWAHCVCDGDELSRECLKSITGMTPYMQDKAMREAGGGKRVRWSTVEADTDKEALRKVAHTGAVVARWKEGGRNYCRVQHTNQYFKEGSALEALHQHESAKKQKPPNFDTKTKDLPLKSGGLPQLPRITQDTPYWSRACVTVATANKWRKRGMPDEIVELSAMLEWQRGTVKLDDGTLLPF